MNEKLVINDEIHGDIELDGVYKELVESKDFQRLKDIIQTGTSYLKYPDMKYETRFDHSIGSYYLICKIIESIEKKLNAQGIKIREDEKEIAKIAMLLHDVGHGAYSHTLEKITGYSHEKRSIDIVKDENTEIHQILKKYYGEEFTTKVGKFLEKVYEYKKEDKKQNSIKIKNNRVSLKDLLASFVSNNIDADRLDYLVRDSQKAGYKILTEVDKLIDSFEFVLDVDKIIVAIPEEKKIFLDMAILERSRNYKEIYFCEPSVIGDHVLDFLLEEIRNNKDEIPKEVNPILYKFLTNKKADFTTEEYMQIVETPMRETLESIRYNTTNEKLKELCDIANFTKTYQTLNTDKDEQYIRYLLHKAIPEISEQTDGIIEETRCVKPYKSNEHENINIITCNGIEDYKDIEQNLIKLEPFYVRTVAISKEMLRLELGISKEKFEEKYDGIVDEVISTITKSKDEFELRYVLTKGVTYGEEIKEKIKKKYNIVDEAKYMSRDMYYDNPENYELLESKKALRVRKGATFHKRKETYGFKKTRATYKTYKKDDQDGYTVRRKEEQIGEDDQLGTYTDFLNEMKINIEDLKPMLEVNNLRYLFTVNVNGVLVDISFNTAHYINQVHEMFGTIGTIEIKPRDNKVYDRLSLLELRQYLEEQIPELEKYLSNTNVYEIGMLDTYEKYKKGYIINDDVKEYEESHKEATKKLDKILESAKNRKDFAWLNEIPEVKQENNPTYQGEEI